MEVTSVPLNANWAVRVCLIYGEPNMDTLPSLPENAMITGGTAPNTFEPTDVDMADADMTETLQGRVIAGRGDAESIAIQVLNFIVIDVDRIIQFLNVTGLQPETIRKSATSSHFLLRVLEYVAKDDELLKAIDQEMQIRPAAILLAVTLLSREPENSPLDKKIDPASRLPRRNLFH